MSDKYLIVKNIDGLVINVIVWDGESEYNQEGHTLISISDAPQGVWAGWKFVDGQWIAPEEPEQQEEQDAS